VNGAVEASSFLINPNGRNHKNFLILLLRRQAHLETLPPFTEGMEYPLYGDVSDAEFQQAIHEAAGCIDLNALNRFRR